MTRPTRTILLGLAIAALATTAQGSSPDAWAQFDARATKACLEASGIRGGRPSRIVGFDDRAGMVALLVSAPRRSAAPPQLCLYDKRAQKAYVDEAPEWAAPAQRR